MFEEPSNAQAKLIKRGHLGNYVVENETGPELFSGHNPLGAAS